GCSELRRRVRGCGQHPGPPPVRRAHVSRASGTAGPVDGASSVPPPTPPPGTRTRRDTLAASGQRRTPPPPPVRRPPPGRAAKPRTSALRSPRARGIDTRFTDTFQYRPEGPEPVPRPAQGGLVPPPHP